MKRPHVQIHTLNLVNDLRLHLETVLHRFKSLPGVVGITLNGGMSRGYVDHLSEIDVTLYLTPETYAQWQNERSPVPLGIAVIKGALYDVKILDFHAEQERTWESDTLWDASYAEILFDPDQVVAALFKEKLSRVPQPQDAEGELFRVWWYFRLAGDIWIHREDVLQGHLMLNQALVHLVRALFLANSEWIPHEKWLIHMSRSLEWQPRHWEDRLSESMNTGELSLTGLKQRQTQIEQLWDEIDAHVRLAFPDLPVRMMQKTFYDLLRYLVAEKSVSLSDWQARASLGMLNHAPFFGLVTIDHDRIRMDHDRLLQTGPDDLYAWHYAVLDAARLGSVGSI
jgi:hypothetical protein